VPYVFVDVITWRRAVVHDPELTAPLKAMVLVISDYMDSDGKNAWPGHGLIAAHLGVSERAVRSQAISLMVRGYMTQECGGREGRNVEYHAAVPQSRLHPDGSVVRLDPKRLPEVVRRRAGVGGAPVAPARLVRRKSSSG
jgi:hypothetical protein